MIRSFRHRGLERLFRDGGRRGVPPELVKGIERRLTALDVATALRDLNLPGWRLHQLKGDRAGRWAIAVNGPWRITFDWSEDGHVHRVDLEQYH